MKADHYKIYGLRVIGHDKFFYIGCTRDLEPRVLCHISSAANNHGNKAKAKVIKDSGFKIEMVEIERVFCEDSSDAHKVENDYINKFLKEGHPLTNILRLKVYNDHKITPLP